MAPTLKEVDSTAAATGAREGEIGSSSSPPAESAGGCGGGGGVEIRPLVSMSSSSPEDNADGASSSVAKIQLEDPDGVPPDEMAFVVPPHFSPSNPFHQNMRDLDHAMRCGICAELYVAPVTLYPCLHAFCSHCVRQHLKKTSTG